MAYGMRIGSFTFVALFRFLGHGTASEALSNEYPDAGTRHVAAGLGRLGEIDL